MSRPLFSLSTAASVMPVDWPLFWSIAATSSTVLLADAGLPMVAPSWSVRPTLCGRTTMRPGNEAAYW